MAEKMDESKVSCEEAFKYLTKLVKKNKSLDYSSIEDNTLDTLI